ncbi:hypothetical protein EV401DRAFT_2147981 [Pisolithus croceorrhizus]|nr:hypothetical protein EV401DRAFT_2147981 [Pisolithus croceorrhizus]
MRSIFRRSPKSDKSSPTQSSPSGQFTTSPHPRPISPLANEIPQSGPGSWQESSTTQSQQHGVDQASRHTVMQEDVADFELAPVNSRNDSFIGTLYHFIVMDVEAFKRHVLGPLFHDLPFADFVQKLDAYDFRTTIKNIRFRNLSATSEGWEFSRPSFRRTTIPSASASDFLSLSNFEPSVEVPPKVAYLLARAQDDISNYCREINYLRGHGSPGRASPGSPSPRVVSPLLQPVKDDDEHVLLFQPDSPGDHNEIQSVHSTNSPSHLQVSTQSLSEFQHHDHPDVHIHPPTPGPPSPQTDVEDLPSPGNEVDISPAFPSAMLSDPKSSSSSPSHTLRGIEPRYSPWPSSRTSPSSEPSSLLSPSHTHSAPFGQPSSYGEDRDDWEMNLVDSLARTGLSRDASRGTEYVDSNMTSPDLADPEEVRSLISDIANTTMESLPTHLISTTDGRLYERKDLLGHFEASQEYTHLVCLIRTKSLIKEDFITEVIRTYFRYAMLSHKWDVSEPLFNELPNGVFTSGLPPRFSKLSKFCKVVKCLGLGWAWCDTCCINKESSAELEEAITSMFRWYRESALTIVYFSDVSGFSREDLVKSKWFKRGWTLQELLAPRVMRFYDQTWTPCVRGPEYNHKLVPEWLDALQRATTIPSVVLQEFTPGTDNPREKLRWASSRVTQRTEDLAYCLFGIFDLSLQPQYGEGEKAFGRLLVELIRVTQDTSLLDWIGKRSERCSILPVGPSGFREAASSSTVVSSGSSPASPQIYPSGTDADEGSLIHKLSPGSKAKLTVTPLLSAGEGVFEVLCFLHNVKTSTRVASGSPSVQRGGSSDAVVEYSIQAENIVGFKVKVSLKDALENSLGPEHE